MEEILFLLMIFFMVAAGLWWGSVTLPAERWQVMAVVPGRSSGEGRRQGINLTYYGVLSANAYTFAVFLFLVLTTATGIPPAGLALFITALLAICMPAAGIVARLVEKKRNTLTVGGAVFVGTLSAPLLTLILDRMLPASMSGHLPVTVILSAIAVAYAFGEGMGRLACLSFGCCYGKALKDCSPVVQRLFKPFCLVFHGKTKKIAYASQLDGCRVIPIQIITAVLYCAWGLVATTLFLNGLFGTALVSTLAVTQGWRIVSEFFRADFRGTFTITPYQIMAGLTVIIALGIALLLPAPADMMPRLARGIQTLWSPWTLPALQLIWIISFVYTGRSSVTGAHITFHVKEDQI